MRLPFILAFLHITHAAFTDFGIPSSNSTVSVRVFNVANATLVGSLHTLVTPILPGHETANVTFYSFLVEHNGTGATRRVMFDLGIRKDPLNFPPSVAMFFESGNIVAPVDKDITELLADGGIALESIENVIWSHSHFDHIGDMSKWPNSTGLVIGSETNTTTFPGDVNATLQDSDFAGHTVTKVDFSTANLTFSGMAAVDYFGDGSLYLLNAPGHIPGHLAALARVTPTSFIVLGGDTFHHAGEARPRPAFQETYPCPAELLAAIASPRGISTAFFWSHNSTLGAFDMPSRAAQLLAISDTPDSFTVDPTTAQVSLEKLATLDADADFFVVVAHDISVRDFIPFFPDSLDAWQANGLKNATVWNWADPANPAFVFSPGNATV